MPLRKLMLLRGMKSQIVGANLNENKKKELSVKDLF